MPLEGEYEPSPTQWVREQVELYESSGGTEGTTLGDTGLPVIILTTRGARSGKLRKFVQSAIYLPHFLSWVVIAGVFIALLSPTDGALEPDLSIPGHGLTLRSDAERFRV